MFDDLMSKYGDEFNWWELGSLGNSFLAELNKELCKEHFLYGKARKAVAKCDSYDDILFQLENDNWAIVHLTHQTEKTSEFPRYILFQNLPDAMLYIEEQFKAEFLSE